MGEQGGGHELSLGLSVRRYRLEKMVPVCYVWCSILRYRRGLSPVLEPSNFSAAKYAKVGVCLLRMVFNPEVQTWFECPEVQT